jgi:hypothetical protein
MKLETRKVRLESEERPMGASLQMAIFLFEEGANCID